MITTVSVAVSRSYGREPGDGARIGASDIMIERMEEFCELCPIMPDVYKNLLAELEYEDEDEDEDEDDD